MKGHSYSAELEDIRRELMRFQHDPQFKGRGRRVPISGFAELAGVSRQTLYELIKRSRAFRLKPETIARIKVALDRVLVDGIRWRRPCYRNWEMVVPPGVKPPPVVDADDHTNL